MTDTTSDVDDGQADVDEAPPADVDEGQGYANTIGGLLEHGLPDIGAPAAATDEAPPADLVLGAATIPASDITQADLDAMALTLFPGIDLAAARVQGRIAQAMASIDAALTEAGRRPQLRAAIEELLIDGNAFLLEALKITVAP